MEKNLLYMLFMHTLWYFFFIRLVTAEEKQEINTHLLLF